MSSARRSHGALREPRSIHSDGTCVRGVCTCECRESLDPQHKAHPMPSLEGHRGFARVRAWGSDMSEKARVLVVDDDKSVLRSLQLLLEDSGYSVELTRSGHDAIERLRGGCDLILADLRLPDLDGISLLRQVKQVSPDTGVIIITGHASLDTAIEAVREGANDYLLKMASTPVILVAIERALQKQRLTVQLRRRNQALATLHAVAAAVSETLDLPDLLGMALGETLDALGLVWGAIWLHSEESGTLQLAACAKCPEGFEESRGTLSPGESAHWQVFETGKLLVDEGALASEELVAVIPENGRRVTIPLTAKGRTLGVMSMCAPGDTGLDQEQLDLFRGVANQIAVGVENARLYQQVVGQAHELEAANTELTATRDALVTKERLAAIGQIVLTVGHEIKNPLMAIWGRANWLLETFGELPDDVKADLRVMQDMCRRINEVLKRLQETRDRTVACIGDTRMIDIGNPAREE